MDVERHCLLWRKQNGLTALHLASKEGHGHVIDELVRRGAAVDSSTKVWFYKPVSLHVVSAIVKAHTFMGACSSVASTQPLKFWAYVFGTPNLIRVNHFDLSWPILKSPILTLAVLVIPHLLRASWMSTSQLGFSFFHTNAAGMGMDRVWIGNGNRNPRPIPADL